MMERFVMLLLYTALMCHWSSAGPLDPISPCATVRCASGSQCVADGDDAECVEVKCPVGDPLTDSEGSEVRCTKDRPCPKGTYCDLSAVSVGLTEGYCCDCLPRPCAFPCESGVKDDEFGCPSCECEDVCETVQCVFPLECVEVEVNCVTLPCPSPIGSCKDTRCTNGLPLTDLNGAELFCGPGPDTPDCPLASSCVIDPTDAFAVCCSDIQEFSCPAGDDPLEDENGVAITCGMGPDRQDCPHGYFCAIGPADQFPFCCACLPILCKAPCPNGSVLDDQGCPTCQCVDVCQDYECRPGDRCVAVDIVCVATPCDSPIASCEPCPDRRCPEPCSAGFVADKDGCPTCDCVDVCQDMDCPFGQQCIPVPVNCPTTPCPPIATCVDCPQVRCSGDCPQGFFVDEDGCQTCQCIDVCEELHCPKDQTCIPQVVQCFTTPCPPIPTCTDICTLPKEVGPCKASVPRYFYNKKTQICEEFTYGGCDGNENNFETLRDCQSSCDVCTLPQDVGPCEGIFPRYFYDTSIGYCQPFDFGGCEGNGNNFESLDDCQDICGLGCPQILCIEQCPLGYQRDDEGCQTCDCIQNACSGVTCEYGNVCFVVSGQPECQPCPLPLCAPGMCQSGFKLDDNGCQTCECLGCEDMVCERGQYCEELPTPCVPEQLCLPQPTCVDCPVYDCLYGCSSGYRLNENGCQGCRCNDVCENFECRRGQECEDVAGSAQCVDRKCPRGRPLTDADGDERTCSRESSEDSSRPGGWWFMRRRRGWGRRRNDGCPQRYYCNYESSVCCPRL